MTQERTLRVVPAAISISVHAAVLSFVLSQAVRRPEPRPEPNFIVTVDESSEAVASTSDVLPAPVAVPPIPPAAIAQAAESVAEQQPAAAPPEPEVAAAEAPPASLTDGGAEALPEVKATDPVDGQRPTTAANTAPVEQTSSVAPDPPPDAPGATASDTVSADSAPQMTPPSTAASSAPEEVGAVADDVPPPSGPNSAVPDAPAPSSALAGAPEEARAGAAPSTPPETASGAVGETLLPNTAAPTAVPSATEAPTATLVGAAIPDATSPSTAPANVVATTPPPPVHPGSALPEVFGQALPETSAATGPMLAEAEPAPPDAAASDAAIPSAPSTTLEAEPDQAKPLSAASSQTTRTAKLETGPSVAAVNAFVDNYSGGPCFYASVARASSNGTAIDAFSKEKPAFQALDDAFKSKLGVEPDILGQRVWSAQCSAVEFLQKTRKAQTFLHVTVEHRDIVSGDVVSGTVEGIGSDKLSLYLINETGRISDLSQYIRREANTVTFAARIDHKNPGGPFPALLIAVSGIEKRYGSMEDLFLDDAESTSRIATAAVMLRVQQP